MVYFNIPNKNFLLELLNNIKKAREITIYFNNSTRIGTVLDISDDFLLLQTPNERRIIKLADIHRIAIPRSLMR